MKESAMGKSDVSCAGDVAYDKKGVHLYNMCSLVGWKGTNWEIYLADAVSASAVAISIIANILQILDNKGYLSEV